MSALADDIEALHNNADSQGLIALADKQNRFSDAGLAAKQLALAILNRLDGDIDAALSYERRAEHYLNLMRTQPETEITTCLLKG